DVDGMYGYDHADVLLYADDARAAMPTLDAVSMATPAGEVPYAFQWFVSPALPHGDYVLFVEVNTEGDHNAHYSPEAYPTPGTSTAFARHVWEYWARNFGDPERGQPSVVYAAPLTIDGRQQSLAVDAPAGFGSRHGRDGVLRPIDETITDDPQAHPGSGA